MKIKDMKYSLMRTIPVLGFAALTLTNCSKDDTPSPDKKKYNCREMLLSYDDYDATSRYQKFSASVDSMLHVTPYIDTVYIVPSGAIFTNHAAISTEERMNKLHERLQGLIDLGPKRVRGRGTFNVAGDLIKSEQDIAWFTDRGWNVNTK